MRRIRTFAVSVVAAAGVLAIPGSSDAVGQAEERWSIRTAESVMTRQPALSQRWHYEVGVMLKAFERIWEQTDDERYFSFIKDNMDEFVESDGAIRTYEMDEYNLDQINAGKLLFPLYERTGEERYRRAIDTLRTQLRQHPRTSEGGFWHKQIYPDQLWLDGVYMAGPFLAKYAAEFDEPEALDETIHEILLVARYMRDPATGLFYHGWDERRTPPRACSYMRLPGASTRATSIRATWWWRAAASRASSRSS